MRIRLGKSLREVQLDKSGIIGQGGEAVIFADPDHPRSHAVKLYHSPDKKRAKKLDAFVSSGIVFPDQVIAPQELAYDDSDEVVGFGMRQLNRQFVKLKEVFTPSFCDQHAITTATVADLFLTVGDNLPAIHKHKFVVGDMNDGALMFHQSRFDVAWVDVDSWHTEKFPCTVGTELYLVPDLYGVDLSKAAHFEPWHDWWSFTVLLFRSLLRKHPFKAGTHAKYRSVLDRAAHGLTVLDSSVSFPSAGLQPQMLTDSLADLMLKWLKREQKGPFPMDALREYRQELRECPSCHVFYPASRKKCPQCADATLVQQVQALGLEVVPMILARGKVLAVHLDGATIYAVCEEAGLIVVHRREVGKGVETFSTGIALAPGMRFGIFASALVICVDDDDDEDFGKLYVLALNAGGVTPIAQSSTTVLAGQAPVFATARRYLYRLANEVLLCEERFGANALAPRPVTTVFPKQCWFTVNPNPIDREVIAGFNRDAARNDWFAVTGVSKGGTMVFERRELEVAALDRGETLLDASVRFDDTELLIVRKTKRLGREELRLDLVSALTGKSRSSEVVPAATLPVWDNIHGKAFHRDAILHPTDGGIVREKLAGHVLKTIDGSLRTVSQDDALMPFGGGILVKRHSHIDLVTPRK